MNPKNIFTEQDIEQLSNFGINVENALQQIEDIKAGFPFLNILAPASLERGIIRLDSDEESYYMNTWEEYLKSPLANVYKMVPASGAASRMFKDLFTFLNSEKTDLDTPSIIQFFERLQHFAFYEKLSMACLRTNWKSLAKLLEEKNYKAIVEALLKEKGLNYGILPKGMIPFHSYEKGICTAAEEHLVEGALYAQHLNGHIYIHFTVSPEHKAYFEETINNCKITFEEKFGVSYNISYSEQKLSTNTIALTDNNELFRQSDGSLLLRPGGHGSLISNLSELDADIVFIKNIDNVVPDHLKGATIMNKKLLGGILLKVREQIFSYLKLMEKTKLSISQLIDISNFLKETLCIDIPEQLIEHPEDWQNWLFTKLDRPIRVCGMVRNLGEPGGGPFLIKESDGSSSLQILENSQINMLDEKQLSLFQSSEYFNPVDIVCSLSTYQGKKFDLHKYINPKTAFLSNKSQNGRKLKALERPGLWNGSMHYWNTIFVDVPIETFNPVKEVNDLLRPEHQGA